MFYQLLALAKPRMVQGKVVGGEDLAAKGLTSFMFDILYVSWFVQIGTTLSNKFWWFYLVVILNR
ncbi:hypothetical protein DSO57_1020007 [Entomophthora muscae]|uniref:Uncharacterized protein n=1 Tax=Entomophthora muscae TaxID=34485 RepID=A0ACC2TEM9_9FUNG|nr:hypothetical protein DSO57_1020007 [Entomophthora muscae]